MGTILTPTPLEWEGSKDGKDSYSYSFRVGGISYLLIFIHKCANHSKLLKSRRDIHLLFSRRDTYLCQIPFKNT
jgi:hypothetical protein